MIPYLISIHLELRQATLLAPLSLRLQRLAKTKPPGSARAQMHKACDMLKVPSGLTCELEMVQVGASELAYFKKK